MQDRPDLDASEDDHDHDHDRTVALAANTYAGLGGALELTATLLPGCKVAGCSPARLPDVAASP
jgi:hypothetical protein